MEDKAMKRRSWIKNIAIIFLVILLFLTFFSNTILNYSLPEVSAQYASYGTITSKIRASGTVEAKQAYSVIIDESRIIKSVEVRQGDTVEVGQVLFTLEDSENEDLYNAKQQLSTLTVQYKRAQLAAGGDYSAENDAIEAKKQEIADAKEEKENIDGYAADLETAKAEVKAAEKALEKVKEEAAEIESLMSKINEGELSDAKESYTSQLVVARARFAAVENELATAKQRLDTAEASAKLSKDRLEAAERSLNVAKDAKTAYENSYGEQLKVTAASILAQVQAIENYNKEQNDAIAAKQALIDAGYAADSIEVILAQQNIDARANIIREAEIKLENDKAIYNYSSGLNSQYEAITAAVNNAESAYNAISRENGYLASELTDAKSEYSELESEAKEAEALVKQLELLVSKSGYESELEFLEEEIEKAEEALELANENKNAASEKASLTHAKADEKIAALEKELVKLEAELEKAVADNKLSEEISKIELAALKASVEKQEAEVKRLEEKSFSAEITAKVAGTVTSIAYVAGQKTQTGDTVAQIQISEKGFTSTISITNEQSRMIKVGDPATVLYYWGGELSAKVASIKTDPSNPQNNKLVTIDIEGDVSAGRSLNFSIGERSSSYDSVVPNSAIREDNNGKYILVVDAKNTPLGNRYTARRVDVSVIASDETRSALSGGLAGGEFVIVTSNKPISAGMQIRMVEEN